MFVKPGHIPRPALWLGLAGILPFVLGALLSIAPPLTSPTAATLLLSPLMALP